MSDLLFEIPENPVPDNALAGMLTMSDGCRIRHARFAPPDGRAKGTVVILQGRNECIEKYFETARDLAGLGFASATFDWRGQGASDRLIRDPRRGYVDGFDDYVQDLERYFTDIVLPDCRPPHYMLAHSTGALVALLAAPGMVNRVRRMVLSAPLLAFAGMPFSMHALQRLSGLLFALGLGTRYMPGTRKARKPAPFEANKLTTDARRYGRNQALFRAHPHLGLGPPTVGWTYAACKAIEQIFDPAFAARIRIPTLFLAAGADEVVSTHAMEAYARRLRNASLLTVDGARHELLQEADRYREQVLAAFEAFVAGADEASA